ncbi:MAG: hypothetical protein DRI54_01405 [Bacteroidetes bacterium]|nr:MAG: hypothetical protein DRI54_01405 [Bacteroidota bacterium]
MKTVIVELRNNNALRLLKDLELVNIIRVIEKPKKDNVKLSDKYAAQLPKEVAEKMQDYVSKNRSEWDRNI